MAEAGIPVSVSVAPIIPFVTEPEIEKILEAAHDDHERAGAADDAAGEILAASVR